MLGYQEDLARLGSQAPVAIALVDYAQSLVVDGRRAYLREGVWWVQRPHNFIAFKVLKRSPVADFSIYGRHYVSPYGAPVKDFVEYPALKLRGHGFRNSWSTFRLENARQLAAAATYIARAFNLKYKQPFEL